MTKPLQACANIEQGLWARLVWEWGVECRNQGLGEVEAGVAVVVTYNFVLEVVELVDDVVV